MHATSLARIVGEEAILQRTFRWKVAFPSFAFLFACLNPVVTPALFGQDTKAADYSKEAVVIERISNKIVFENDGTSSEQSSARVRIQSQAGLQQFGILNFPYASATSTLEVVYVRAIKPDGRIVQTPSENILEMPADITRQAPFYSDVKVYQVAVKGLEIGDTLEYESLSKVTTALNPGQFWVFYNFVRDGITLDENLQISVPRGHYVKIQSPKFPPAIREEGAYKIYNWKTSNLVRKPEAKGPKRAEQEEPEPPSVQLTSLRSWDELGQWFQGLIGPKAKVTPEIKAKADELTRTVKTDAEKIQALYNYVSTKFRYIGISLGIGRYQPHAAADVLSNDYGDCKDKHTLFAALLAAENIKAFPVLINSTQKIDPDVPSPSQFDHVITAVPQPDGYLFLDTTPEVAPFGFLLEGLRDKQALVIPDKGPAQLVRTPADPPFKSFFNFQADGALDDSGTLVSRMQMTFRGDVELPYRITLRQAAQPQWNEVIQRISGNLGFGGTVSDVTASSPDATEIPFRIEYKYTRKSYSDWENKRISPPFPPVFMPEAPEDTDKEAKPVKLGPAGEELYQATLRLPANAKPRLPSSVNLQETFAEYRATYSVSDGVLHVERRLVVKAHEVTPAQFEAYRKFENAIKDDVNNLISVFGTESASEEAAGSPEAQALYKQGVDAWRKSDMPAAADAFQRAVDKDPKFAQGWLSLGGAHYYMGKEDQGITEMKKSIAIDPGQTTAYKSIAMRITGVRDEQALDLWRELDKQVPNDPDVERVIGVILVRQKHYAEALKEFNAGLHNKPDDSDLLFNRGNLFLKLGEKDEAAADLIKAGDSGSGPLYKNGAAYSLADNNLRLNEALRFAEQAVGETEKEARKISLDGDLTVKDVRLMPNLANYWDTLGWVHFRLNHLELAEKYLVAAWSLTQDPTISDHLGQVLEKEGKRHEAAVAYSRALSASHPPDGTRAKLDALRPEGKYQAGEGVNPLALQDLRTTKLGKLAKKHVSAEFFILFAPGPKVVGVKFISGAEELRDAGKILSAVKFDVPFPTEGSAQILRRGILDCEPELPGCLFVFIPPDSVQSLY
jgi:tetratricopeptide (TPR) repeat protein/transglutaminase-like putative cysteine protease